MLLVFSPHNTCAHGNPVQMNALIRTCRNQEKNGQAGEHGSPYLKLAERSEATLALIRSSIANRRAPPASDNPANAHSAPVEDPATREFTTPETLSTLNEPVHPLPSPKHGTDEVAFADDVLHIMAPSIMLSFREKETPPLGARAQAITPSFDF